jgi:hypothetical protein
MENPVGFKLTHIITVQFAAIEQAYKGDEMATNLAFNFRFEDNKEEQTILASTAFSFVHESPFLVIEAACYFKFAPESWKELIDANGKVVIPTKIANHLLVLTIGTTRGVLHTKTEGTKYNKFILPTINVADIVKDNVLILE